MNYLELLISEGLDEMASDERPPEGLSEPAIVAPQSVSGFHVSQSGGLVRIVGWDIAPLGTDDGTEARVGVRLTMTPTTARSLMTQIRKRLSRQGH